MILIIYQQPIAIQRLFYNIMVLSRHLYYNIKLQIYKLLMLTQYTCINCVIELLSTESTVVHNILNYIYIVYLWCLLFSIVFLLI